MKKILVADDEPRMLKLISDFLGKEGYEVITARDGKEAVDLFFENSDIELVLLDVMMPEYDGWTVCRKIKKSSQVPVIMITARTDESDELFGFELGADEYIKKPFSPKILVARVNATLKRGVSTNDESYSFDELKIDEQARRITVDGENIELSVKEYELLTYMVRNKGIALSRDKIIEDVWEFDFMGDERTLDTHIKKLRKKLGTAARFISTVWGFGYRFEGKS